jgi:hypothetical protein
MRGKRKGSLVATTICLQQSASSSIQSFAISDGNMMQFAFCDGDATCNPTQMPSETVEGLTKLKLDTDFLCRRRCLEACCS